jgi:hypothetical protein
MIPFALLLSNALMFQCMTQQLADISFGQRQLEQFICDCPDAGEIIKKQQALREELVRRFAGQQAGHRMHWDNREPMSPPADHWGESQSRPAVVHISSKLDATDKCYMLLFELTNFEIDKEIGRLWAVPSDKRPTREEYSVSCLRDEFEALKSTQLFFKQHPITEARSQKADYYNSAMKSTWDDFAKYLQWHQSLPNEGYKPLVYFGQIYDGEIVRMNQSSAK